MIEILTVIAIIAIITGITVVGLKYVAEGTEERQTRTKLEGLRSGLAAVTNTKDGERKLFAIQLPSIYFVDTNNKPASSPSLAANKTWVAVPASAIESLYRTGKVYKTLKTNAEFAAIFNGIPADQKVKLRFVTATMQLTDAPPSATVEEFEFPLDAWKKPILFVFDNLQEVVSSTTSNPLTIAVGGTNVLTGGLTNLYSVNGEQYWEPTTPFTPAPTVQTSLSNSDWIAYGGDLATYDRTTKPNFSTFQPATDSQNPTLTLQALRSNADRRPFFFSAGPDGKYHTHDDNVYSFTN